MILLNDESLNLGQQCSKQSIRRYWCGHNHNDACARKRPGRAKRPLVACEHSEHLLLSDATGVKGDSTHFAGQTLALAALAIHECLYHLPFRRTVVGACAIISFCMMRLRAARSHCTIRVAIALARASATRDMIAVFWIIYWQKHYNSIILYLYVDCSIPFFCTSPIGPAFGSHIHPCVCGMGSLCSPSTTCSLRSPTDESQWSTASEANTWFSASEVVHPAYAWATNSAPWLTLVCTSPIGPALGSQVHPSVCGMCSLRWTTNESQWIIVVVFIVGSPKLNKNRPISWCDLWGHKR